MTGTVVAVLHGRIALVVLLLAALLGAPASASAAPSLDVALQVAVRRQHAPQVSAAIVRDGRVVWSATTGGARPGDRFVIASATKTLVATLVLRLVDGGRLSLADPVERYVPGIPNGTRITLAELLAHRSGLAEYFDLPGIAGAWDDPDHAWSMDELLAAIRRSRPAREPGTRFVYTNTNYVLLGAVLEQVTGEGLETLLRRELADPLGLGALSFERVAPAGGRLLTGHERRHGRLVDLSDHGRVPNDAIGPVWPDGGIATTAGDLARFLDGLLGGRVLAPATLAQMTDTADDGYGYGLETISAPGGVGPVIGHDGVYGGYTTYDFRSPRTGATLVVLANLDTPADPAWSIADALWRAGADTYSR